GRHEGRPRLARGRQSASCAAVETQHGADVGLGFVIVAVDVQIAIRAKPQAGRFLQPAEAAGNKLSEEGSRRTVAQDTVGHVAADIDIAIGAADDAAGPFQSPASGTDKLAEEVSGLLVITQNGVGTVTAYQQVRTCRRANPSSNERAKKANAQESAAVVSFHDVFPCLKPVWYPLFRKTLRRGGRRR